MAINKRPVGLTTLILILTLTMSVFLDANTINQKGDKRLLNNPSDLNVVTHLTIADGMSSDIVRCIYRDSHNLLWIGTSSGLNRWDGHEMRVYSGDQINLPLNSGFVSTIQEDSNNNLWIEWDNKNLIYLREYDRFIPAYEYVKELKSDTHYNVLIDNNLNIWACDESGVLSHISHNGHMKCKTRLSRDFGDRLAWAAHPDGGILILCSPNGIMRISPDMKKEIYHAGISNKRTFDENDNIFIDNSGKLWIYSYRNTEIHGYDPHSDTWLSRGLPGSQDSGNCINGIIDNNNGILWISTDHQGIYLYDKENDSFLSHLEYKDYREQPLVSNRVTEMFRDKDGNIWLGFLREGVTVVHSSSIIKPHRDKEAGDVLSLLPDETGKIWIGTDGNGVYLRDNNGKSHKWAGVPDVAIMSLSKGHDGKIYAGTYDHGIYVIQGDKTTHYSRKNENAPTDNAWITKIDRNGNLWFGSTADGLFKMLSNGEIRRITHPDGSQIGAVCLFDDNSDSIYVGTVRGYVRVNITNDKVSTPITGNRSGRQQFLDSYITNIFKDSDDIIWLGHFGGLTAYDQKNDSVYTVTRIDGLADNTVSDITEDSRRVVWVGTYNGLSAISKSFNDDKSLKLSFLNYSVSDGLCSNYISTNSFSRLPNNDILIGGVNGFSILQPGLLNDMPTDRKVVFTSLKIGGREVTVDTEYDELKIDRAIESLDRLVLNNPIREVTVGFASNDILSNSRMTYAYRILGLSDEWILTDKHEITVSQFPAGKYDLQIKAMNSNGEWSDDVSSLKLIIKLPWFLSWWAILSYLLVAACAITFIILYRRRRLKEKRAIFELEENHKLQRQLNEAKLQFFTNVSHDLKTPLTLILSPLQLLIKGNLDEDTKSKLNIINRNASHLLSLIENLLDFRKIDIGGEKVHAVKCDVINALTEVCDDFKAAAALRDVKINVTSTHKNLYAETDIVKIKKSLYNVLSNALKFSPDKSTINVEFKYSDNSLCIKVSDQGSGVPDDIKKEIFSRFFQGDHTERNPGSGIGLHIVNEYLRIMHGYIEVTDNDPTGAVFSLFIPMKNREEEIKTLASAAIEMTLQREEDNDAITNDTKDEKKTLSVIIVDDNKDLCVFLADALRAEGYNAITATNGEDALKELEKNNIDIVVSDVMMSGMDGVELCKRIKTDIRFSHIPVILLTAKSSDEARLRGLESGADDYLTKPFNFDILILRVQKFIELKKETKERFRKGKEILPADITITPLDEQFMQKAVRIVEEHISDMDFDVETLSSELAMSRGHLYKKLMGIIGMGPSGLIRSIRIKRGRQLLEKSQMRISEIAFAVGYNTPKRFSISFKEEYGMSPTEYINSLKNKENQEITQK